jgi:hypothetical protein
MSIIYRDNLCGASAVSVWVSVFVKEDDAWMVGPIEIMYIDHVGRSYVQ